MNHDATHCADWTKDCPKDCYRAQLTEDLKNVEWYYRLPVSWAHLKGTIECADNKDRQKQT